MNVPGEGDLVRVRGLHWVVTGSLQRVADPPETLTDLMSVTDGHYGKTLRVVWELEPDRRVLRTTTMPLPEPDFDEPDDLVAFLDAIRWSAVTAADDTVLQSPFRSGIHLETYQLEPVIRAVNSARINLLLADDVGLGKTIEAGLVALELLLRQRVETVMVVAPAELTIKWRVEMAEKFGLDFTIVDSALLRSLRRTHGPGANPFEIYRHTIVSLTWVRGARAGRLLNQRLTRQLDLLVVDEAHHIAPAVTSGVMSRKPQVMLSQQTRAIRELAPRFRHRLFLSATPHNGYTESFVMLLEMLDPQRFVQGVDPRRDIRDQVMIRRLKGDIRNPDGSQRFRGRAPQSLEVNYPEEELQAHEWLTEYIDLRRRAQRSRQRPEQRVDLAALILKKRLFSSPAAFRETLQAHLGSVGADHEFDWLDEDEELLVDLGPDLSPRELELLMLMRDWAAKRVDRPDAKAWALLTYLKRVCRPVGRWTDERVVVFTEYRATALWLLEQLRQEGMVAGGRTAVLHGDTPAEQRERLRHAFQVNPESSPLRILLATDVAGEGVDLQRRCHRLVNYDIPFNPTKLEQRIGRIDRYGQDSVAEVHHFVGAGWEQAPPGSYLRDLEFLSRIAVKMDRVHRDLGQTNRILAQQVEEHMLGRALTVGSPPPEPSEDPPPEGPTDRLDAAVRHLRITSANSKRVLATALRLSRQQPLDDLGDGRYGVPVLTDEWTRAAAALRDPITGQQRPITFDARIAAQHESISFTHLGHPLMATSINFLRSAMWRDNSLRRVTAVISDDSSLRAPLAIAYSRLVLVGAEGVRLHEELFHCAVSLVEGYQAVGCPDPLAGETPLRPVPEGVRVRLCRMWPMAMDSLLGHVASMARSRTDEIVANLGRRQSEENRQIDATLKRFADDLEVALETAMVNGDDHQAARLRRRIASIEDDRIREHHLIDQHYRVCHHHVFSAALTFVIPEWEASR
ncbi:helicase-related protein [Nonomuraea sp. NPDC059023]|uniref:helicase-related protein n=1 Tax=unclassified Nonomuraea TaxID=2593643 RepID=UPI0036CB52C3